MGKNKYARLSFDVNKVPEWIRIWCESNMEEEVHIQETKKPGRISYSIKAEKDFMIDFLECNGGAYTIQFKIGKNPDISEKLAESIYTRITAVGNSVGESNNFSIVVDEETYNTLIGLLCESDECSETASESRPELGYKLHKFRGRLGDTVTLKYFLKNKRIQIQGRPLCLFHMIQGLLMEDESIAESVVEEQIKYYNIDENIDDIKNEMCCYFGESLYGFFTKSQQMILHSFFVLNKVNITLPEYSVITSPVLHILDGYILKLMVSSGIVHDKELVGHYFYFDGDSNKYILRPEYYTFIGEDKNIKSLEKLYGLYNKYRNPYSHTSECDFTTQVIGTRKQADEIAQEILLAIKTSYEYWKR